MEGGAAESTYSTPFSNSSLLPTLLLSLAFQKHSPDTQDFFQSEYDYIIVGAGTAGSVVASRLSELDAVQVLLLEAGKTPPILTEIPALARSFVGTDLDWNYLTAPQKNTAKGFPERRLQWPSGKAIGGSSIINSMLFVRGNRRNYDQWAAEGAEGWSYDEVLPYFKKLEGNREIFLSDPGFHCSFGPMTASRPVYYPTVKGAILNAALELGYPIVDANGREQYGFFDFPASIRDGQRCSPAKAYLVPAENRTNLDIVANAFVTKILIEDGRALGVQVDYRGSRYFVRARREVIVSAGVVNSAKLLMMSGIGPKMHLEDFQIPVLADLPVGQNLHDHCASIIGYRVTDRLSSFHTKVTHPDSINLYIDRKRGPLTSAGGITNTAFLTNEPSETEDALPDHQLYFIETVPLRSSLQTNIIPEHLLANSATNDNGTNIWCVGSILNPKSRGSVFLNSTNPYHPPIIDPNYLQEAEDLANLVEALKQCDKILSANALSKIQAEPFPGRVPGCEQFANNLDEYLPCKIRYISFPGFHAVGTAKMGHPSDPTAVVDPQLRVLGIPNIRVVDSSVMPTVPSGGTYIPTIMIAEKASDMIKATFNGQE